MTKLLTILVFILTLIIIGFIAYFLIKKFGLRKTISGVLFLLTGIVVIIFAIAYKEWIDKTASFLLFLFSGVFLSITGGILITFGITKKKKKPVK
ncbi:MAG TPA: hypothetical protein PKN48_09240 [Bacteroidales bacterium]|nr:hypothetical protein [Bacteroidales bacterium]